MMMQLNRKNLGLEAKYPIKIVQFGKGNFLRAFAGYAFQKLNAEVGFNAGIAVVPAIDQSDVNPLEAQDGLYTLFQKGLRNGVPVQEKEIITTIVANVNPYLDFKGFLDLAKEEALQFMISNTTEAGIVYLASDTPHLRPPKSFPAKLTLLLYQRFTHFKGDIHKGLTLLPCELIEGNADRLKEIMLRYAAEWQLGEPFKTWLLTSCSFHNTLVDRIVPGYPKDDLETYTKELDYTDALMVTSETFFLWVIEGDEALKKKLPFHETDLEIKIVPDVQPYRSRKVSILNGAHTCMVPFALLYGHDTVRETMENSFTGGFIRKAVFEEIIPTLEMDREDLKRFAETIFERFKNPFIQHHLASIALNSISKFKVRVLPSLLEYTRMHNAPPLHLTFAFACLLRFYRGSWEGNALPLKDEPENLVYFKSLWETDVPEEMVPAVLAHTSFWGEDLSKIRGLSAMLVLALKEIERHGIEQGFYAYVEQFEPY
jgi:tagaturonate reductase